MKILFVGVATPPEVLKESFGKYYDGVAQVRPQQSFDYKLIKGMSQHNKVQGLSLPAIEAFPRSKCLFYYHKKTIIDNSLEIKYISLINLPIVKSFFIFFSTLITCLKFALGKGAKKEKAVVVGYVSFLTSVPLLLITKIFKIKFISIVPDLPSLVLTYKSTTRVKSLIYSWAASCSSWISQKYDGYVLFTVYMNEIVNKNMKPWIVIEGMVEESEILQNSQNLDSKYIMYAGTLHEKFGIGNLVQAFKKLTDSEVELWIFGQGDFEEQLSIITEKDIKIKYFGTKTREEIQELAQGALVLINPRSPDEEFTKYSFPSKTLEYMATGRPLVTTKLKGIPSEYYDYVYSIKDGSVESIELALKYLLSLKQCELSLKGLSAQNFILKEKTITIQAKKISDFIFRL